MEPITRYADVSGYRADWQKEYRFGVVLVVPPEPVLSAVSALRLRYDPPSGRSCPAHISLSMPVPREVYPDDLADLRERLRAVPAFTAHYGPIINFLPDHAGVVFDIREQREMDTLRNAIEAAPLFAGMKERRFPFHAHMTVAEFISKEDTVLLTEELRKEFPHPQSFECRDVAYIVPDDNLCFTVRETILLGLDGDSSNRLLNLSIRNAMRTDAEALTDIQTRSRRAAYGGFMSPVLIEQGNAGLRERWKRCLSETHDCHVADYDGLPAGFLRLNPIVESTQPLEREITTMYLAPEFQRRGIGRRLMERVLSDLKADGCRRVFLWVLEENVIGRAFYERAGFVADGARERWKSDHPHFLLRYARDL